MKSTFSLLSGVALANAHSLFSTLYVNGKSQGDGTCVRMNMDGAHSTDPIASLSSDDMACGKDGLKAVKYDCQADAGSKLSFEWRMYPDLEQPGAIDKSHKGPCAVYAKQLDGSNSAAGPGWFKIWEEGYDEATGKWCTEKLIANDGFLSVSIPEAFPTGSYLFRPELLALHEADKGDPQFYVGCAQVQVQGTSNAGALQVPSEYSVSIPGYVKAGEPSVSFNIYQPRWPYTMPGPKVFTPAASTKPSKATKITVAPLADDKMAPAETVPGNCLIMNANWCGVEVPSYSTEAGCWDSSENCWTQTDACYESAPPTGSKNCEIWEDKCQGIVDACSAGQFKGPPNKGAVLKGQASAPEEKRSVSGRRQNMKRRLGRFF